MPLESEQNRRIALFLVAYFLQGGVPLHHLTLTTEIAVSGRRVRRGFSRPVDTAR